MLAIRLRRIGKKSHPTYRIVVAEHTAAVQGSFVADLGFYNPHTKAVSLKKDEIVSWMNKGAKPSNTVARVLEKEKIKHKSVVVSKFKKAPKKVVEPAAPKSEVAEMPAETVPTEEVAVESAETETPTEEPAATEETPADPA